MPPSVDDRLAWRGPEAVAVIELPDVPGASMTLLRVVRRGEPLTLRGSELALIPVARGDWLQLPGSDVEAGLATGAGAWPDAVTFWPPQPRLYVPTWSTARFVALRSRTGTAVHADVRIARAPRDAFVYYRYDEALARWAEGTRSEPAPEPAPDAEAAAIVRVLAAEKRVLREADVPPDSVAAWLVARWQEASLAQRPLLSPYFARQRLQLRGGRALDVADDEVWRELSPGEALHVTSDPDGFIHLLVRGMRPGETHVEVLQAQRVVHSIFIRGGSTDAARRPWTRARALRVPLAAEGALRVRVRTGSAQVRVRAYRRKGDLLDAASVRAARKKLAGLRGSADQSDGERVLASAARARRESSASSSRNFWRVLQDAQLPDAVQALWEVEALRYTSPEDHDFAARVRHAWSRADGLDADIRLPLQRRLLGRLVGLETRDGLRSLALATRHSLAAESHPDALAVETLLWLFRPRPEGLAARPPVASRAEAHAAATRSDAALDRARGLWSDLTPLHSLDAELGVPSLLRWRVPQDDAVHPERCQAQDGGELRYTRLTQPEVLEVGEVGGTHAVLSFTSEASEESWLHVDGVAIAVHGALGLTGRVALRPGTHRFDPGASPLLVRIPRRGPVPCAQLRQPRRYYEVTTPTRFVVPLDGGDTMARVELIAPPEAHFITAEVSVGDQRFSVWARAEATGAAEVPVASGAGTVRVAARDQAWARVSARLALERPAVQPPLTPEPQARPETHEMLEQLREWTVLSRHATGEAQRQAWLARARLLWMLGYRTLSQADALRAGVADWRGAIPDPSVPGQRAAVLPEHAEAVVPYGYLSKIPPLPTSRVGPDIEGARGLLERDASSAEVVQYLGRAREGDSPAADLLNAVLAQRVEQPLEAADYLERFGQATGSDVALARAAALATDAAAQAHDPALAMRALTVATLARELGPPEGPLEDDGSAPALPAAAVFARLSDAIHWVSPATVGGSAGTALVEHVRGDAGAAPLGEQVRRALLDSPPRAVLIEDDRTLRAVIPPARRVQLKVLCHALSGAQERCEPVVLVDGTPEPCQPLPTRSGVNGPSARPTACVVAERPYERRVEVRLPPGFESLGWAELSDDRGDVIVPRSVSAWHEIDAERPLELRVAGPTVVRLRARGEVGEGSALHIEVVEGTAVRRRALALPGTPDPLTQRFRPEGQSKSLGAEVGHATVVRTERPVLLRVGVDGGRALLQVQLAQATGHPAPLPLVPPEPAPEVSLPAPPEPLRMGDFSPVPSVTARPLTVGAGLAGRHDDLGQYDDQAPVQYLELYGDVLSELVSDRMWLRAELFHRLREGFDSSGVGASLVLGAGKRAVPGLFASGRLVLQPYELAFERRLSFGAQGTLGVFWWFTVLPGFALSPRASGTFRHADDRVTQQPNVDPQVYTAWADDNPRNFELGLRAIHRPLVDALWRYEIYLRSRPQLDAIDRVDFEVGSELWPGRGLAPWLEASVLVSYRPTNPVRNVPFTRTDLELGGAIWHWLLRRHRIVLSGRAGYRFDFPTTATQNSQAFSASLVAAFETSWGRGVSDFAPATRRFRERSEEGTGRVRLAPGASGLPLEDVP